MILNVLLHISYEGDILEDPWAEPEEDMWRWTVSPDQLKIKVTQGIFKQNIKPKCQIKWEEQYGGNIDWTQICKKFKKIKATNKIKEFQWKCLHNINYTEHRLKKK